MKSVLAGLATLTIAAGACASSSTSNLGAGTSSHPALADVAVSTCGQSDGLASATGLIDNHSSGTSDYIISIGFFANGVRVDEGDAFQDNVAAHSKATYSAMGTNMSDPANVTCKVVNVTRMASSTGQNS